jgi:hypothetical protein
VIWIEKIYSWFALWNYFSRCHCGLCFIQAYLFPAKIEINGHNKNLDSKDTISGKIITHYVYSDGSTDGAIYDQSDYDFTTWNEKKLYDFLNDVLVYTHQIAMKSYPSKEEIMTKYQAYFSPQLSAKIVDSLFLKTDDGWKVPDGE